MEDLTGQILAQWGLGALIGVAMAAAFLRAFFSLMQDNRTIRKELVDRHMAQEERFFLGLLECINKNTEILERAESALRRIGDQLAEQGLAGEEGEE